MGGGADRRAGLGSNARIAVSVLLLALSNRAALAQSVAPAPTLPALPVPGSITEPPPDLLDGTLSGLGDELEDDSPKSSWLRFPSALQPWLDFKQQVLLQQYGFLIGGSEGFLGQDYSNSLTNDHNSVGQKFTLNVGQQLLWRGTPQALWIEMVVEDRGCGTMSRSARGVHARDSCRPHVRAGGARRSRPQLPYIPRCNRSSRRCAESVGAGRHPRSWCSL